jgi:putative membrane protein
MFFLIHLIFSAVAIMIAASIVPGVVLPNFLVALLVALVLGVINTIIRPIITILTLPINILTLGLFSIITNALLILLAASIVPRFQIQGFIPAILFGIVLSLVNIVFSLLRLK